jgi:colanic acid biosynthesis glycosyl transferase WcaI
MKILIYGLNYAPELTGIGKYTSEMAKWLAAQGHQVRVVTAPPYYPAWRVFEGFRPWAYTRERQKGVEVWRAPLWVPQRPGGLTRLLHLASFALTSLPVLLRHVVWRPQVVWVVAPAFTCLPGALLAARLSGAKSWLHIQDFEVDAAFELGLLKGRRLRAWVTGIERWFLQRFDRVSTLTQAMLARAATKGVPGDRLVLFPNWVDTDRIRPMEGENRYRQALNLPAGQVVALYSGNMGAKQGLELLSETARQLASEPNLTFVFCGDGVGRPGLESQCAGLPNVHFLPLQPEECLSELLSMADIHLLPQRADASDLVMPSKLLGMLASGRPVVATALPGSELDLALAGCGFAVAPRDEQDWVVAIQQLSQDKASRQTLGDRGREKALRCHSTHALLSRFQEALRLPGASGNTAKTPGSNHVAG